MNKSIINEGGLTESKSTGAEEISGGGIGIGLTRFL